MTAVAPDTAAGLGPVAATGAGARTRWARRAAVLGAGALVAASLPPWGWWPLGIVGVAVWVAVVLTGGWRERLGLTWLFGVAWFAPGMGWMWFLTAPGYVVAVALYSAYLAVAAASVSRRVPAWWRPVGLAAALTSVEALRWAFPFGGVPLASLPIAQVGGPLAPVARVGGPTLFTFVVLALGAAVAVVVTAPCVWSRPTLARAGALVAVPVVAVLAALTVAPGGSGTSADPAPPDVRIALVQGGGEQGTRAITSDPQDVFDAHAEATRAMLAEVAALAPDERPELILWPENTVDPVVVEPRPDGRLGRRRVPLEDHPMHAALVALTAEAGVPIAVGITVDVPGRTDRFVNEQIVYVPDGDGSAAIAARYRKLRIVPFGEYLPFRGLLSAIGAPVDLVPRDALAGTAPALLPTPVVDLASPISWEVFFAGRARSGVLEGAEIVVNPTNGSSYTGTVLQTQQVASSRLRAIETGRVVLQVAPTGFSAVIGPDGAVRRRSGISERIVLRDTVERRSGLTWATRTGDTPWVAAAALAWAATVGAAVRSVARDRARQRSAPLP
jgi:apolipoprotein N-acyltransferase